MKRLKKTALALIAATALSMPAFAGVKIGGNVVTGVDEEGVSGSYVIPLGVTRISDYAFYDCVNLMSVIIPGTVTKFGLYAFSGCTGLTSVVIPPGAESTGYFSFSNCSGLTTVMISSGVKTIGAGSFSGCSSLLGVNIPSSVATIDYSAFGGCARLAGVNIPEGVKSIGSQAFVACTSLANVAIPGSVTNIGVYAFKNTAFWNNQPDGVVTRDGWVLGVKGACPSGVSLPLGVKAIAEEAFAGCTVLTSVTIPDGMEIIGRSAFNGCTGLKSVTIPGSVKEIRDYAFLACGNLETVRLMPGVGTVSPIAFRDCGNLVKITIPSTLADEAATWTLPSETEIVVDDSDELLPSPDMPCLGRTEYVFELFAGFGLGEEYEIHNQQAMTVALKKVGKGKLPTGVKLKYDKKSGKVLLSGAPTKAGEYVYMVRLEEKVGREKRTGPDAEFKFVVRDISKLSPGDRDFNPSAGKKIKLALPMFTGGGGYAGLLNVSVSAKGAITASIKGVAKRTLSFKGNWQYVDDGDMGARLAAKTGEILDVVLGRDGNLRAVVSNLTGAFGSSLSTSGRGAMATAAAADYAPYVGEREVASDDDTVFTLKISKTGKASFKCASNKSLKGTAQLLLNAYDDGSAQLCIAKTVGKQVFSFILKIGESGI